MKIVKLFAILIICFNKIYAQDLIFLKNSDTIKCKIREDKITFLNYVKYHSSDTSIYQISQDLYDYYVYDLNPIPNNVELLSTTKSQIVDTTKSEIKNPVGQKKGVYLNFNDYVNNNPSFDFDFVIEHRSDFSISMIGGNDYKIISMDEKVGSDAIHNDFWCVCDGKNCVVNSDKIAGLSYYCRLRREADYAYFYSLPIKSIENENNISILNSVFSGGIGGGIVGAYKAFQHNLYKINLQTGKIEKAEE